MRVVASVVRPAARRVQAAHMASFSDAIRRMTEMDDAQAREEQEHYPPAKVNTVINITPQGSKMIVERLGKYHSTKEPGWFFAVPLIDRITAVHDMREMCLQVSKQQATTKDNVRLSLEVRNLRVV
jgi:hypothetical protein